MEKTITQFKTGLRLLFKTFILVALGIFSFSTNATAQYSEPWHYYGCGYAGNSMMGAIEEVEILDESGNQIYYKVGDGCNEGTSLAANSGPGSHYRVITYTPSFTLSAGSKYTLKVTTSNGPNYSNNVAYDPPLGVWIDYNSDEDFADAGEFITPAGIKVEHNNTKSGTRAVQFTVPCGVSLSNATRMRIRTNYSVTFNAGDHSKSGTTNYYGETEDFTLDLASPATVSADFFVPDTVYTNTIVKLINGTAGSFLNHWDVGNNGTVDYTTENAEHIFNATGTYSVKLKIANCAGADSLAKNVVVVNPSTPPIADFVSSKGEVELFDVFRLTDLSTNGATYWDWYLTDGVDTIDGSDVPELRGGNPYLHRVPEIFTGNNPTGFPKLFPDRGLWTVCLVSSNSVGASSMLCKQDYIEVTKTTINIGPETILPANVIALERGTLYDKGGPDNNYTVPESNLAALIAPCGATSVTGTFSMFRLNSNATIQIFDGPNALAPPLHTSLGFTAGNPPTGPIVANSGMMYILWNSIPGPTDSGFAMEWSSEIGIAPPPVADFIVEADTIYNSVFTDFINTSLNADGKVEFEWRINGSLASISRDLNNQAFTSNGSYAISLRVIGCDGVPDDITKNVYVKHPGTTTNLDFVADNTRPNTGQAISLTAISDKANRWEWSFFPANVETVGLVSDELRTQQFKFTQPGKYTVQCRAYNVIDESGSENLLVKSNYIIVVDPCVPIVSVTTSADVAISRVVLEEDATGRTLIDNASTFGVKTYQDFVDEDHPVVDLNFGGTYNFHIHRFSNSNMVNRKIWIDWNVDGDFDDPGEEVASHAANNSLVWSGSFAAPNYTGAFQANTRMRIGVSYGTDANRPCGANSAKNANRIGEFEDYAVRIKNDGDIPVLSLVGGDTTYVEQNSVYIDPGAIALDPSQGDISHLVTFETDVDVTLPSIYSTTYNVTDASGNSAAPISRTVYVVVDQTPPLITLNPTSSGEDTIVTLEVGSPWADPMATAHDNKDGDLTGAIVVTGSVNPNVLGTYEITYFAQDAQGNSSTNVRTVHVVDTEFPVIDNASADKTDPNVWKVELQLQSVFVDFTRATDNYNSITDNLVFTANPGVGFEGLVDTRFRDVTRITYTATDESGNSVSQIIDYIVEDYEPPVIDLHTLDTVMHPVNHPYNPVNATATDNLYDNTQISLTENSNVNPYILGTYQDVYTATDAAGNVGTRIRYVKVFDGVSPVISGKNGPVIRVGLYSSFASIERLVFTDNYDAPSILKANAEVVYTDINTYVEGLYSATFITHDNSGNYSNPFTLLVVVSRDEMTSGIDDLDLDEMLNIAPNPSAGVFNVMVDLPENEDITVGVYNSMGQKVSDVVSGNINHGVYQVDMSNNANGFYYVRMQVRETVVTKKVILNR